MQKVNVVAIVALFLIPALASAEGSITQYAGAWGFVPGGWKAGTVVVQTAGTVGQNTTWSVEFFMEADGSGENAVKVDTQSVDTTLNLNALYFTNSPTPPPGYVTAPNCVNGYACYIILYKKVGANPKQQVAMSSVFWVPKSQ